jgi:hypothetical protein
VKKSEDSRMKLFSWFIKANKNSKTKRDMLATTKNEELETKLNDKSTAFNNNTMWPIAKVITTTNLINNYNVKVGKQQDDRENDGNNKKRKQV